MVDVKKIFGIKDVPIQTFVSPERQNVGETEDYAVKKVVQTNELIVSKLFLDKPSNTYLQYNTSTSELELYVNGVIRTAW